MTGASSGIGLTFAERLAGEGYDLVLVARRRDRLEQLTMRLRRDAGVAADVLAADLAAPRQLAEVEARAAEDEALTLLVNNAGFGGYRPFAEIDSDVIDNLIGVHIRAVARLTRAALPGMIRQGNGGIINVASLLALSGPLPPAPLPHRATYAGAKAFMLAFTQALSGELKGTGVKVQACLPGRESTEFHAIKGVTALPSAMTADDVVTASLASLAAGEVVCIPGFADPTLIERLTETQVSLFRAAVGQSAVAARYRAPTQAA